MSPTSELSEGGRNFVVESLMGSFTLLGYPEVHPVMLMIKGEVAQCHF